MGANWELFYFVFIVVTCGKNKGEVKKHVCTHRWFVQEK